MAFYTILIISMEIFSTRNVMRPEGAFSNVKVEKRFQFLCSETLRTEKVIFSGEQFILLLYNIPKGETF